MPQRGHRQGRPGHRPHQVDPGSRHVRGRFPIQGVHAGREFAARLQRRSASARRHPGPPGIAPARWPIRPYEPPPVQQQPPYQSRVLPEYQSRPVQPPPRGAAPDQPVSLEPPSVTDRANGVPATYDFRRPYGRGAGAAIPVAGGELPARGLLTGTLRASTAGRRSGNIAQRAWWHRANSAACAVTGRSAASLGARGVACGPAVSPRGAGRPARPCHRRTGRGIHTRFRESGGDARMSDRVGARTLDRQFGAAGGDALVRRAGRRDQADLRLFVPRHERQSARAHFRARLRQRARHRRLHARRRTQDHGEERLARACPRSRASCATCRAPPAINSRPCWRRARTSITTITSTSI